MPLGFGGMALRRGRRRNATLMRTDALHRFQANDVSCRPTNMQFSDQTPFWVAVGRRS